MKKVWNRSKEFVYKHRVAFAFGAGATTMYLINRSAIHEWNDFLEKKGLTDEFYAIQ